MTIGIWSKLTYILFFIAALVAGVPGVPKVVGTPRHFLFLALALFLASLSKKSFRMSFMSIASGEHPDLNEDSYEGAFKLVLCLAVFLYLKVLFYNSFSFNLIDVDFSYFDQMIGSFVRGQGWFTTACDCNHMGVHSTYLFFLIAPFHYLFNSPLVLQIVHGLALASSLIPLKMILDGVEIRRDLKIALLFSLISYSPFIIILDYNFHFEVFYIPVFLFMMSFYQRENWKWFHAMAFLSLLIKEDAGFYLMGVVAALVLEKKSYRNALSLLIYSILMTIFSLKVFIPWYRESSDYIIATTASLYGSSFGEVALGMLKDPFGVLKYIVTGKWWKYLIPFAALPVFEAAFFLCVVPFVIIHSTAASQVMRDLMLYYVAPYLPFLLYFFIQGTKRVKKGRVKNKVILFSILFIALVGGGRIRLNPFNTQLIAVKNHISSLDLSGKIICAQGSVVPQLGYSAKVISLPQCEDSTQYDYIFLAKDLNPYPFNTEKIASQVRKFKRSEKYILEKQFGEFYVFQRK